MIIILLLILGFRPFAAAKNPLAQLCGYTDSDMNDSTYQANLKLLSTDLSKSASSKQALLAKGFVGTHQNRTYGVAVCRGDFTGACPRCITRAFHDAWRLCGSYNMQSLYEDCIVHISGTDLIYDSSVVLNSLLIYTDSNTYNIMGIPTEYSAKYTDVSIDDNIMVLLQVTVKQAAYNSQTRYATGRMDVNSTFPLLYSSAQCNLDLQRGEWIAGAWCNLRYHTHPFYEGKPMKKIAWSTSVHPKNNTTAPQPAPEPVGDPRQKDENKPIVVPRQKHKSKQEKRFFHSPKN